MGAEREATQGAVEAGGQPAVPHVAGEAVRGAVMAARAPLLSASDARLAQAGGATRCPRRPQKHFVESLRRRPIMNTVFGCGAESWPTEDVAL